jgi:broad specificity phosphatase PhoE
MSVQKRYAGRSDVPLTEVGVDQAAAAAKRLAPAGIDVIVTSPLLRATQTAQEVAEVTGAPVVTDEGFRETDFGAWEGLTFAEVRQRWPAEMTAWLADPAVPPPGGESLTEVGGRVTEALHRVLAGRERQTILIVSHVTPIKTLVAAALLAPPAALYRMHLDVAALCEIDWYADGPAVLRSFNDTGHMAGRWWRASGRRPAQHQQDQALDRCDRTGPQAAHCAGPPRLQQKAVLLTGPPCVVFACLHEVFMDGHGLLSLAMAGLLCGLIVIPRPHKKLTSPAKHLLGHSRGGV